MKLISVLSLIMLVLATCPLNAADGLVAHYSFDRIDGPIVPDLSGNGNNGRIIGGVKPAVGHWGAALEFDGIDGYVDCGANPTLDMTTAGTVTVWCRPGDAVKGGLIARATGSNWEDMRLLLAIYTWRRNEEPWIAGSIADGKLGNYFDSYPKLVPGQWVHLAFTFDGKTISVYGNGILTFSMDQTAVPNMKGVPLTISRCTGGGLGDEYFCGMIDDVRLYNRGLSHSEILGIYKADAAKRGHDLSVFEKPVLKAAVYDIPGKAVATVDTKMLQPLPSGASIAAELLAAKPARVLRKARVGDIPKVGDSEAIFDLKGLLVGTYTIRVQVIGPGGKHIGKPVEDEVCYKGVPSEWKGVKILNNLCWELANLKSRPGGSIPAGSSFNMPRDRWVFVQATADLRSGGQAWASIDDGSKETASSSGRIELMRCLKAGKHTLHLGSSGKATIQQVVVRAVPELQYAFYGASSDIAPYGPYDWSFLTKDILPNANTIIDLADASDLPLSKEHMADINAWRASGRRWLALVSRPDVSGSGDEAVRQVMDKWSRSPGLSQDYMDGIMVDEFEGTDHQSFDAYRAAVQQISAKFPGKVFRPYFVRPWGGKRATDFFNACVDRGDIVYSENYLSEPQTEADARRILSTVSSYFSEMQQEFPGGAMKSGITLSDSCAPTISLNSHANVDYRVFQDMQFRLLATHPALFGLNGIQEYHSGYCDEETLRLTGRLMRHYALEGSTQPLIKDPYKLSHITNPEFIAGTAGWEVSPAEEGSVQAGSFPGYAKLQGRYSGGNDTFLLTRRSAVRPNRFSQKIVNLTPGRLYSMKMITGDYGDLAGEVSDKKLPALSIKLENVELLTGPRKSFDYPFPNNYSHSLGKFNASHKYWMNFHWRVFRAKGKSAKLTVSDWQTDTTPGGPIGQQLMLGFIEIEPYIGE